MTLEVVAVGARTYGIVSTAAWAGLELLLWTYGGARDLPTDWIVVSVVVVHGLVFALAFQPGLKWKPVVPVTPARIWTARVAILLAGGLLALHLGWASVTDTGSAEADQEWAVFGVISSMMLFSSVYLIWHWSLRPEAFIPPVLIRAANPLPLLIGAAIRRVRFRQQLGQARRTRAARRSRSIEEHDKRVR